MRIAICEDLSADNERLFALLEQYCANHQLEVKIDRFPDADTFLEQYHTGDYQILFLDIFMKKTSGMDAARRIREVDADVAIIFTTVSREFAVDSYAVNAAFYIVKPVEADSLALAMNRCRNLLQSHAKAITVTQSRRTIDVCLRDILYLESRRNDCFLFTSSGEIRTRALLSTLEAELGGLPFLRCHRSFIVNLHWVADMLERDFVLKDGIHIPISRAYHAPVQQAFVNYLMNNARGDEASPL